jgi:hypothetical protein
MAKSIAAKQTEEELVPLTGKESAKEGNFQEPIGDVEAQEKIEEMVQIFGGGLQSQFDKQVALKEEIEQRWLDDLRHYNGVYDKESEVRLSSINKTKASKIFVNLTRAKCNTAESKWSDLVLPTDDRNWGIKPTPVPSLVKALTDESPLSLVDGSVAADPETGEPHKAKDLAEEEMKQANDAAKLMENEIHDQLTEANYNPVCREVITDAVVMGTGIIKGPMIEKRRKKAWIMGEGGWQMDMREEVKPTAERVDPWNFFPDMSAIKWTDSEFIFERHLLTRKHLRDLAKQPGFMAGQVAKVLMNAPNARNAKLNYLNELREVSGITSIQQDNRYEVLEYHGPIDKKDLIACGCDNLDLDDPLEEFEGVVWLCMGIVIKVGLNHMDSEELPYDVLNWEKDTTTVFGFGVPYRMRAPQKVMNASWRMVLDNAGLSTGPQILINRQMVEPADGVWELSPRKIWWMNTKDPKFRADYAMQTFAIDSRQQELQAIFEQAHRLADEETSVPQMQMGNQAGDTQQPAMLKTLGGTALWMSSNNIMMRRAVKNFDDDITVPFITRFYDWNMQFNEKDEIKGDYSIDARGTSVLLVREMQARNIMEFINAAMAMPGGPEELDTRGVLKNMAKGMQVSIDDVMRSDDDKEAADEEAKTNPPIDPETMKLQMQMEIEKMKIDASMAASQQAAQMKMTELEAQRQIAMINREVELIKGAATAEFNFEKLRSETGLKKYETDWNIKAFYEELAEKRREGDTANYGLEAK